MRRGENADEIRERWAMMMLLMLMLDRVYSNMDPSSSVHSVSVLVVAVVDDVVMLIVSYMMSLTCVSVSFLVVVLLLHPSLSMLWLMLSMFSSSP